MVRIPNASTTVLELLKHREEPTMGFDAQVAFARDCERRGEDWTHYVANVETYRRIKEAL